MSRVPLRIQSRPSPDPGEPVASSTIDDYEWKLVPSEHGPGDDEIYFVLSFNSMQGKFILEHDNGRVGMFGDFWITTTYTEIDLEGAWLLPDVAGFIRARMGIDQLELIRNGRQALARWWIDLPPPGLLHRIVSKLTAVFKPNRYSIT